MDDAFNKHSPHLRDHKKSHTNLNHLTLAPLTSRLPLSDPDALPEQYSSYIEGRSAPTTPSILSRSSSRVAVRKPANLSLAKSKSSTHLDATRQPRSVPTTPGGTKLRKLVTRDGMAFSNITVKDRSNSEWLLRTGAAMSSSARESKGQTWLVSRASSTSLTGQGTDEEEELEQMLAKEREINSRHASRRGSMVGSVDADDEFSPNTTRRSLSYGPATGASSRPISRFGSRANSRRGSRVHLTPMASDQPGYFDQHSFVEDEVIEPDFVGVEEDGDEAEDMSQKDEAAVRTLARASSEGLGGWVGKMLGWTLFAVDEDGEEVEAASMDEKAGDSENVSKTPGLRLEEPPLEEIIPPIKDEEVNGWQDAAWLLSVATKVLI